MSLSSDLRGELIKCQLQSDWVEGIPAPRSPYAFTAVHKALEEQTSRLEDTHHHSEELVHADQVAPCFTLPSSLPSSPNPFASTAHPVHHPPEMTLPFTSQGNMQGLNTSEKQHFVVGSSHSEIPIAASAAVSDTSMHSITSFLAANSSQTPEAEFHIDSLAEEAPGIWAEDPDLFSHSRAYEDGTPEWDDEVSCTPASADHVDSVWVQKPESQIETSRMHSRVSSISLELALPFAVGMDIRHPPFHESGSSSAETGPTPPSNDGRMWQDANTNSAVSTVPPRSQAYSYSAPALPSSQPLVSFHPRHENSAPAAFQHLPPPAAPLQRQESSQHAAVPHRQQQQPSQYVGQDNYFVNQPQQQMMSTHTTNYHANNQPHTITSNTMSPTSYDAFQQPNKTSSPMLNKPSLPLLKCSCAWRCCELVTVPEREWITDTFSALTSTDAQDEYLQGLMKIEDRRSKNKPQGDEQDLTPGIDDDAQAGSKRKLCPSLDDDEINKRQRSCESDSTPSRNSPSTTTRPRKSFNTRFYCRVPAQLDHSSSRSPVIPDSLLSHSFDSPSSVGRGLPRDPSLKYIRVCHSTFLALYQVSKKRVHKCALLAVQQPNKTATF